MALSAGSSLWIWMTLRAKSELRTDGNCHPSGDWNWQEGVLYLEVHPTALTPSVKTQNVRCVVDAIKDKRPSNLAARS